MAKKRKNTSASKPAAKKPAASSAIKKAPAIKAKPVVKAKKASKIKPANQVKPAKKKATGSKKAIKLNAKQEVLMIAAPKNKLAVVRDRSRAMVNRTKAQALVVRMRSKNAAQKSWKAMRPVLKRVADIGVAAALVVAVIGILFFGYSSVISDRIMPNTDIIGISVSGQRPDDALQTLEAAIAAFEERGIPFNVEGKSITLKPIKDLGVHFDPEEAIFLAYSDGHTGTFIEQQHQRLGALTTSYSLDLPVTFDRDSVTGRLRGQIPELAEFPENPKIEWIEGEFVVTPGVSKMSADIEPIIEKTESIVRTLSGGGVSIVLSQHMPAISDDDAYLAKNRAMGLLDTPIELTYREGAKGGPWTLNVAENPSWIIFTENQDQYDVSLDPNVITAYLNEELVPEINQEHSDARVTQTDPDSWYVTVEGKAVDGDTLLVDEGVALINETLKLAASQELISIELPGDFQQGLVLNDSGEDMGLRDLIAHGRTSFAGSPYGRDYNIRKGMQIYNGILIPQGERFAFNSYLGPVDLAHGWKNALTIFGGGLSTEPSPGGGLCQVSTTVYQAAVKAGLKVETRRAHSYFVSYYSKPPGLSGVDATIYPGSQDLVFINDTPGPILMLAGAEGNEAYVQMFGIKDREVSLAGPYRSGSYGAGGPIYTVDPSLAPGEAVIDKNGHTGFSISWNQTINYDDGTEREVNIYSGYKAIPAQGRRGPDVAEPDPAVAASTPAF